MNKITDTEIMNYVNQQWEYIKQNSGVDNQRLMGIFAIGKVCHGFAENINDINLVVCYIPDFEQLCLNTYLYKYGQKCGNVQMTDFRYLYDLLLKQDLTIMECTFTDYKIINDNYIIAFKKYIEMNKESIFRYNPSIRIENAVDRGIAAIERYYKQNSNNINDLYDACRIRIACELMLSGSSIENCINLKKDYHINYLYQILNGVLKPSYEELNKDLLELKRQSETFIYNEEIEDKMKEILFALYTIGLTKKKEFKILLTENELQAFDIIKNNLIHGEGYISITTLTEKSHISRPVFKNVMQKMKDTNVAEVINKGVKGTYIKIKDFTIL